MDRIYNPNTPQWSFFAWASFASAVVMVGSASGIFPPTSGLRGTSRWALFF